MARTTKTMSISLPPEMADMIEQVMAEAGRTKSELLREAIRQYILTRNFRRLANYGQQRASELGIKPEDVEHLIDESRTEERQKA